MDSDDKVFATVFLGFFVIFFVGIWSFKPSQMQICIKAGYEWRGGDCVKAVDHADQQ